MQKKKEEEDKRKENKYLWARTGINRVKRRNRKED